MEPIFLSFCVKIVKFRLQFEDLSQLCQSQTAKAWSRNFSPAPAQAKKYRYGSDSTSGSGSGKNAYTNLKKKNKYSFAQ